LRIAHFALERKLWIILDECYSELVRTGATARNAVQLLEATKSQTILVNSFSKSHAVTGWICLWTKGCDQRDGKP
jgi:aspartate aminotransferase